MTTKLQQQLFEKYPDLFQNKNKSMRESAMFWGLDIGDGWYSLLDELCANVTKVCPTARVSQCKEKFGQLVFYSYRLNGKASDLIKEAEIKSETICEICGKVGKNEPSDTGWYRTRCEEHKGIIAD